MGLENLHYQSTRVAVALGPRNLLVRYLLRARTRKHGASLKFADQYIEVCKKNRIIRVSPTQFVFVPDIAQMFDKYFEQVVPVESEGTLIVDYSSPRLQRYSDTNLEFELTSLAEEEDVIGSYFRWYRPRSGDTVFDIGAHCGVSTYHLSQCVGPTGKVYAFEPDRIAYAFLQRNITRHSLSNVTALRIAVAGSDGTAEFCSEGTLGSSLRRNMTRATIGRVEEVSTISLQSACERYGVPAFAKIDIEGSELEVLSASQQFLRQQSIHFVLDTNHRIGAKLTASRVEALFEDCGYVAESSAEFGAMTTWARRGDQS